MALSGTITGKADNTSYTLTCEWSATQSISNNTSTITANVYLKAPSGWSTDSSNWNCTINGTQVTSKKSAVVSSTKVLLGTRKWTVTHGSNGVLSTSISFSYSNGLSSAGTYTTKTGSGSATVTLDTIPRTSSFTLSSSSLNMGSAQTVTISRASSSFTHTVQYTFGSSTTTAATKSTATSISFTPPTSLASQVPSATSGTCTVKVTTYNGDTSIGSASKTFTLNVPPSIVPSVSVATTINNALGGLAIAGKSTVTVTPTGSGNTGSSISSYAYSGGGLSGTGSSKTTGTLSSGTHTFSVTAKDSRGRTATASKSITVYAYSNPTLSINVYRADSSGNKNGSGTYARAKLTYAISNPNNANVNAKQYKIEWKNTTATSYSVLKDWTTFTGGYTSTSDSILDLGGGWATTTSYDIRISIKDSYTTTSATQRISTIAAILDIEKSGIGIGKLHERGALDIQGTTYITGGALRFAASPSQYSRVGYYSSTESTNDGGDGIGCTFISNGSNNWFRLKDDGSITWKGLPVVVAGTSSLPIEALFFKNNTGVACLNKSGGTVWSLYVDSNNVTQVANNGYVTQLNGSTINATGSLVVKRSGAQFRARPAAEGQVVQVKFEDSSGNHKGYMGSPNGNYEMHIQSEVSSIYLRGKGIYCRNNGHTAYVPCYASAFTVNSESKWKKNINALGYNAMDLINQTVVYEYELKDNTDTRDVGKKTIGLVIDYETPEEIIIETEILDDREYGEGEEFIPGKVKQIDKGVDLYAMSSLAWKALQEKDAEIKDLQTRVGHLEALVKQLLEAKN